MKEKKKSNKGLIVVIIILVIALLSLGGYVLIDKDIIKIGTKEDNKIIEKEETKSEKQLDINSRLVQTLYNQVTTGITSCQRNWIYRSKEGKVKDEFYVEKATEEEKMNFVGNIIVGHSRDIVDCNSTNIPDELTLNKNNYAMNYSSVCKKNKDNNTYYIQYVYSKQDMEVYYKTIFGSDAKLDTKTDIFLDTYSGRVYHYVSSLDKYVLYERTDGIGGTCGPILYDDTIESATLKDNSLKIREKEVVTTGSEGPDGIFGTSDDIEEKETYTYVYSFEKESDGMYKFISRIKENK